MLLNVSELLIVVANSSATMYDETTQQNMTLVELLALQQFMLDMLAVVSLVERIPPIIVEIQGDESFVYGKLSDVS